MSEQTTYSTAPVLEEKGMQWYCPHYFSISGLQVGCRKGIWPMKCHEGCPYGQWVEWTMTSTSVGCDCDTETYVNKETEKMTKDSNEKNTKLVEVYDIDGHLCIGEEIEDAIRAYKSFYPTSMIKKITKIFGEGDILGNAIMLKEKD